MSLSVGLITRDHEASLPRALRSVAGVADEVLVLDTGSADGTLRVAAESGARVARVRWDDDFGAACNAAVAEMRGDWFLLLNHDEELLPVPREVLEAHLTHADVFAYTLRVEELRSPDQPPPLVETVAPRLIRRHPDVRFVGRLHPRPERPFEELAAAGGQRVAASGLVLRHHAYLSEVTEEKLRWALRLLERELADRPDQLPYQIEYGLHLLRVGEARGHDVLAGAASRAWAAREQAVPPDPAVARLLEYLLTVSPELSRAAVGRGEAAVLALHWFPASPVLLWRLAEGAFRAGDFRRAAGLLERLAELARTGAYDRSAPFDPGLLGPDVYLNLARCRVHLGQLDGAEDALALVPPGPQHKMQAEGLRATVARLRGGSGARAT